VTKIVVKHREAKAGEVGLFPVDQRGFEVTSRIKLGREVTCDVRKARNTRQLRLFWVIVDFVAMHCPMFEGKVTDDIAETLKVATGLVRKLVRADTGEVFYVVRSIAEKNLEQDKFDEFFRCACDVIANRWMASGTTPEDVRKELLLMVDGPGAIGSRVA